MLIAASLLVALMGVAGLRLDNSTLMVVVAVYVIWGGASESVYSLASAHANDRAGKEDLVALSSSMLFAWSVAGFVAPGLGTILTALYGTQSFIYVAILVAGTFCGFVFWRVLQTPAVPSAETGSFAPMTAQAPLAVDLAFSQDELPPKARSQ